MAQLDIWLFKMKNKRAIYKILTCICFSIIFCCQIVMAEDIASGVSYYEKGQFERAILVWEKAINNLKILEQSNLFLDTLRMMANAYQFTGHYKRGINLLTKYLNQVEQYKDSDRKSLFYSNLGNLYLANNDVKIARLYLKKANIEAQILMHPYILAVVSNNFGNVCSTGRDFENALKWYKKCLNHVEKLDRYKSLQAEVLINMIRVFIKNVKHRYRRGDYSSIIKYIENAYLTVKKIQNSNDRAKKLVSLTILGRQFRDELLKSKKELDLPVQLIIKGEEFYLHEVWDHAALSWEEAMNSLFLKKYTGLYLDAMLNIAKLYKTFGQYQEALDFYHRALPLVQVSTDKSKNAIFLSSLGDLYLFLEQTDNALLFLSIALDEAKLSGNHLIIADVFKKKAGGHAAARDFSHAIISYENCLNNISKLENTIEENTFVIHEKTRYSILNFKTAIKKLSDMLILNQIHSDIFIDLDKIDTNLSLLLDAHAPEEEPELFSNHCRKVLLEIDESKSFIEPFMYNALNEAINIASKDNNSRVLSYAQGFLGELYEIEGLYSEAIKSTRKAIFFAQEGNHSELLYQWYWQFGRLLKRRGNKPDDIINAIKAYEMAIYILNTSGERYSCSASISGKTRLPKSLYRVKPEFIKDYYKIDSFENAITSIYKELVSILFDQISDDLENSTKFEKISKIIEIMERLKKEEVIDFYRDDCAAGAINKIQVIDQKFISNYDPEAAILYPIIFNDYMGLILINSQGLFHKRVMLDINYLKKIAREFRLYLQTKKTGYKDYAIELYNWLIAPFESQLEINKIKTLVIIPDSTTRLIPFAALRDGDNYLIEKYSIVTLPFLYTNDIQMKNINKGIVSWSVDKKKQFLFNEQIGASYNKIERLLKDHFIVESCFNLNNNLSHISRKIYNTPYSFIYLSHNARFGQNINESWVMVSDFKENMGKFQDMLLKRTKSESNPKLLIINRCETDYNSEKAMIGLLTLSFKTGAESVISSLWTNNDKSTLMLIEEYFKQIKMLNLSKAEALKNAQNVLINTKEFEHPAYWAPFIFSGKWK